MGTSVVQTETLAVDPTTGLVQSETDALGRVSSYSYDDAGNRVKIVFPSNFPTDAGTTLMTYTPDLGELSSLTDPNGHTTNFWYDGGRGDMTGIEDPLGHLTTISYDGQGRQIAVSDPLAHTTQSTYAAGDLLKQTSALGNVTTYQHDGVGRLIGTTSPVGAHTSYAYDGWDRLTSTSDALNETVSYTYDGRGNLVGVTDPRSHTTSYGFDEMNRQVYQADALGYDAGITYFTNGLPHTITDRKRQVQDLTYDARNRLSEIDFHLADGGLESKITYLYDNADRMTQATDSLVGTISRVYDNFDNLITETTPLGSVSYTYDFAHRRTGMSVAGQMTVTYLYDAADRLSSITKGTDVIGFGYDNANRRTSMTLPDGISVAYGYDNDNRLTSVIYTKGATTIGNLTYSYDPAGRLVQKGGSLATVTLPAAVVSATYNANNQLTLWGSQGFSYDLNGNMTSDGTMSYQWNTRNQLVALDGGTIARFTYDAFGRRQSRLLTGTNTDTEYLYDISGNIAAEYKQDGGQPIDGGQLISLDLSTFRPDELVCTYATDGGLHSTFDTLTDSSNGSIIGELTDGGIIQASYAYEPYGQTQGAGDAGVDQQYGGRENDGTGLYFNRWRYYLPVQGRFIGEDPLGNGTFPLPGQAWSDQQAGPNLYQYAGSDPIGNADPEGLAFIGAPQCQQWIQDLDWTIKERDKAASCGDKGHDKKSKQYDNRIKALQAKIDKYCNNFPKFPFIIEWATKKL